MSEKHGHINNIHHFRAHQLRASVFIFTANKWRINGWKNFRLRIEATFKSLTGKVPHHKASQLLSWESCWWVCSNHTEWLTTGSAWGSAAVRSLLVFYFFFWLFGAELYFCIPMAQRHIEPISVCWASAPISTSNGFALKLCRSVRCIKDVLKGCWAWEKSPRPIWPNSRR